MQQQDGLVDSVTSLAARLSYLGQQFSTAAQALEVQGEIPPEEMLKEAAIIRSDFEKVRDRALSMAATMGIVTGGQEIRSLAALQPVFRAIADAEHEKHDAEQIRRNALEALGKVMRIQHHDDAHFPPLLNCQDAAQTLSGTIQSARWTDLPTETFLLARQEHAFSDLLALAEDSGSLDDEQWALLQKKVSDAFDRSLSLAAARGRLVVSGDQSAIEQSTAEMIQAAPGIMETFHILQSGPMQSQPPEKKPRWGGFRFT